MDFIEEFWPVAFFFVMMGISYARNAAKMKKEASQGPQEVLTEEFPTVDSEEFPEVNYEQPGGAAFNYFGQPKQQKKVTPKREVKIETPTPAHKEEEKKERLISMKNKSEAKRAFIYSEIFNRKY